MTWLFVFLVLVSTNQVVIGSNDGYFAEVPRSQIVQVGSIAVFRCRPIALNVHNVFWTLNRARVGANPPLEVTPGTIRENGNVIDTLTIICMPTYNNSEIICMAEVGTESLSTRPAALTVLPSPPSSILHPNASGFVLAPVSQNITVGATVHFTCQHTDGDVFWRINGEDVNNYPAASYNSRRGLNTLTIRNATADYDGAEMQCLGLFGNSGRGPESTRPAILQLQGQLVAVSGLRMERNSFTLFWVSSSSLDLTGIDPDVVYCVEVFNITCGRRDLIISDCSVMASNYTLDDIGSEYIYEYIVTPRSNVPGSQNGTPSQSLTEQFSILNDTVCERTSMNSVQIVLANPDSSGPVPTSITLSLKSLDGLGDYQHNTMNISQEGGLLVLDVPSLPRDRLWNCTVLAYGCEQNKLLSGLELSTHSVQNMSITSYPGQIRVTGDFIDDSTATGVLITVVNKTNTLLHTITKKSGQNDVGGAIVGLTRGQYTVSVFVVDRDGVPFSRVAIKPRKVFVEHEDGSDVELQPQAIKYKLQKTSTGVCITCIFLDNSTTDHCVAIVHERISHLNSSGLSNIVSVHKLPRSGDTAHECICMDLTNYQIGVIDGQLVQPQASSSVCTGCIAGSVLAVVFFLVSLSIFIPVVLKCTCRTFSGKERLFVWRNNSEASVHNMEEGCNKENVYEDVPPSKPIQIEKMPGETEPLIRAQSDGSAESNEPQLGSHNAQTPPTSSSPVTPQAAAVELTESTGALSEARQLQHHPFPGVPAPPLGNQPQYATVNKFQNSQGLLYECVVVKPSSTASQQVIPDDFHKTSSQYSEIIHPPNCQEETTATTVTNDKPERRTSPFVTSPPTPFTVENLLPFLHPLTSKWLSLGEALLLDEDCLDEIFTNNGTDEGCLQEMLELYMRNCDFDHNWEEMVSILRKAEEETIAAKIEDLHIKPLIPQRVAVEGSRVSLEDEVMVCGKRDCHSNPEILAPVQGDELQHATMNNPQDKEIGMESARTVLITTSQELVQTEELYCVSESGQVSEETTESVNQSTQESKSDDISGSTIISRNGTHFQFKPKAQSTPKKGQPPNGVSDASDSDPSVENGTSVFVQNSAVHKRKGHGVTKSPTYIVNSEAKTDANENNTSTLQPVKAPGGDSAYHDTCSVPGDLDSCLSLNEPYSGVSDTDLGYQTADIKTVEKDKMVSGFENTSTKKLFDGGGGGGVVSSSVEKMPAMEDRPQVELFISTHGNGSDAGPLVQPQTLDGN